MTWSAWLRPSADGMTGVLFSRRDKANAFVVGLDEGRPYVEVGAAAGVARTTATAPLPAGGWHHLAVTTGEAMTLYVDGSPVAKLAAKLPALGTAALVGGDKVSPASPARPRGRVAGSGRGGATPGFEVDLDELEIALGERPPGYIRTAALSQASDPGKFLAAGEPEVRRSWGSGNFAIIVRSVTFDGWIVIGLLAVMAAVSWMVLVEKGLHLRAVRRANARFLERFRPASADLHRLLQAGEGASPLGEEAELADSPLYRLFRVAAEDVRRHTDGGRPLTPEGLAAVRSALDTTLAEEVDALARRMVVLTIAISGGPFLGLLGTVVGVMITFASIAAAGDVNVTAIAPGIAAALMATVAGLVVAIPSLFGYNWLLTRIKSITRGLQVFVDELVTRSAAACASRPGVPAPAEEPAGSSVREPILAAG
jgi:biopolymer transport protein ExbB